MSGRETCEKVIQRKKDIENEQKKADTLENIYTLGFNKVFDTGRERLETDDRAVKILTNNIDKIKKTIVNNFCQNIQDVNQKNVYIQPSSCYRAINEGCTINGVPDLDCVRSGYKYLDQYSNQKITQDNRNVQRADCEINSIIGALTEEEQNLDNLALIKALQDKASSTPSTDNSCSEITSNVTQDKYIASFLDCSNKTSVNQLNVIKDDCIPLITSQRNINNNVQKCLINSGIFTKDEVKSDIADSIKFFDNNSPSTNNSSKDKTNESPINLSFDKSTDFMNETTSIIIGIVISILLLGFSGYHIFKRN